MIAAGLEGQVRAMAHAAQDVNRSTMDHRRASYARGVRDALRLIVGDMDAVERSWEPTLEAIYQRYLQRMETLPTPDAPGHEWQRGRATGATTCSKCGLLPLDEDDVNTDCPADTVNRLTTSEEEA